MKTPSKQLKKSNRQFQMTHHHAAALNAQNTRARIVNTMRKMKRKKPCNRHYLGQPSHLSNNMNYGKLTLGTEHRQKRDTQIQRLCNPIQSNEINQTKPNGNSLIEKIAMENQTTVPMKQNIWLWLVCFGSSDIDRMPPVIRCSKPKLTEPFRFIQLRFRHA